MTGGVRVKNMALAMCRQFASPHCVQSTRLLACFCSLDSVSGRSMKTEREKKTKQKIKMIFNRNAAGWAASSIITEPNLICSIPIWNWHRILSEFREKNIEEKNGKRRPRGVEMKMTFENRLIDNVCSHFVYDKIQWKFPKKIAQTNDIVHMAR